MPPASIGTLVICPIEGGEVQITTRTATVVPFETILATKPTSVVGDEDGSSVTIVTTNVKLGNWKFGRISLVRDDVIRGDGGGVGLIVAKIRSRS
mmetsp:Transcript_3804/g.9100  ORF Transcript_3804/g.9100 Transcript_3804/m.9100 type:complete len:95 (-) Transcript_3804:145-429(-)